MHWLSAAAACLLIFLGGCSERADRPQRARSRQDAAAPPALMKPKVLQFYASPGIVTRGEPVTLCYGVEGAERLELEPPLTELRPSRNRCVSVAPKQSGILTLRAIGPGGQDEAQLAIRVLEPNSPPLASPITIFTASSTRIQRGERVTVCYGLTEVRSVHLDPPIFQPEPGSRCFAVTLQKTTTFKLRVIDPKGRTFERELTVEVE